MSIDYKKELEAAAKSMILVHDPHILIKLIVRMIVQKVEVSHAGILLHHQDTGNYVLTFSRGLPGIKIPRGFARLDRDNALIRFFEQKLNKDISNNGVFVYEEAKSLVNDNRIEGSLKQTLTDALYQMEMFSSAVCIPGYFRDELLALLLLGCKQDNKDFGNDELDFLMALASDVSMAIRNARLFKELEDELEKKRRLFIHTSIALAAAIDAKDHYTHGHTMRVTSLSLEIARRFSLKYKRFLNGKFFENLHIAGLLHDIGKIGVPESILNKQGPLNVEEREKMKEHTRLGSTILMPIKELEEVNLAVKYHHENYDGTGYPEGLRGDQIPLIAAIISVADTFDAITTDRPYRRALSKESAIEEIKRVSGKQLNPEVVQTLLELYQENKI